MRFEKIENIEIIEDFSVVYDIELEKNHYFKANNIWTHNCRLRSNTENPYINSFGSGSVKIGSIGVCTLNLPRLAFKCKGNEEEFFKNLVKLADISVSVNNAKRHIIKKRIDNGNLPLYTYGFMELQKQYSTIGLNGINEACEILGYDILTDDGQRFVTDILNLLNDLNEKYQKKYKFPHNLEQVPSENVAVKLCEKDKILNYHKGEYVLYSNQFIPLITNADLLDRIKLQGMFDGLFSGGSIMHLTVEEKIDDPKLFVDLIKLCAKMGVVYWAVNYTIQRCENDHVQVGNGDICYECGGKITDLFTRVVGFIVPVKAFNKVRREYDFPFRKKYNGEFKKTIENI